MKNIKRRVKTILYYRPRTLFYKTVFNLFPTFFVSKLSIMKYHGKENFMQTASRLIPYYLPKDQLEDSSFINAIKIDMVKCYFQYAINPEEYLIHDFRNKSDDKRKEYISKKNKDKFIALQLGDYRDKAFMELKDKYQFYKLTSQYFKRDACQVKKDSDFPAFKDFVNKHDRFIAKPVSGRFGRGTCIISAADYNGDTKAMFDSLLHENSWIVEELIHQDERMAVWNESSVNTVRIPSFRTKDGVKIVRPFFRMGRKGSVVDNAGNGGIFFSLDAETGCINTLARDEKGNTYTSNPDNGKAFKDWQVPEWDALLELSKIVHESLPPYHKHVGFDFALSKDKGWQLVEGNWSDFICQQSTLGFGIKKEFLDHLYG